MNGFNKMDGCCFDAFCEGSDDLSSFGEFALDTDADKYEGLEPRMIVEHNHC